MNKMPLVWSISCCRHVAISPAASSSRGLPKRGYRHEVVRQEAVVGDHLLPRVNRVVALFKRWWLGVQQGAIRSVHLDAYLDEFTCRFNRRTSRWRGQLFYRLVQQAVCVEPVLVRELLRRETGA